MESVTYEMRLRATRWVDLQAVVAIEVPLETARWLGRTGRAWHDAALGDDDVQHLSYVDPSDRIIGFGVLAGLGRPGPVELRRLAVARKDRGVGHGRRLLHLLVDHAGRMPGRRTIWLDVKTGNERARVLYEKSGFVVCEPPPGVDAQPGLVYLGRGLARA